jgi:hypothetical protein
MGALQRAGHTIYFRRRKQLNSQAVTMYSYTAHSQFTSLYTVVLAQKRKKKKEIKEVVPVMFFKYKV